MVALTFEYLIKKVVMAFLRFLVMKGLEWKNEEEGSKLSHDLAVIIPRNTMPVFCILLKYTYINILKFKFSKKRLTC